MVSWVVKVRAHVCFRCVVTNLFEISVIGFYRSLRLQVTNPFSIYHPIGLFTYDKPLFPHLMTTDIVLT